MGADASFTTLFAFGRCFPSVSIVMPIPITPFVAALTPVASGPSLSVALPMAMELYTYVLEPAGEGVTIGEGF